MSTSRFPETRTVRRLGNRAEAYEAVDSPPRRRGYCALRTRPPEDTTVATVCPQLSAASQPQKVGTLSEKDLDGWQGIYHPDASPISANSAGPFIKAYAIEGFVEFAFNFSNVTLAAGNRMTPGMSRTRTIPYEGPFEGTAPHFVVLRSFSGKFVTGEGKLTVLISAIGSPCFAQP